MNNPKWTDFFFRVGGVFALCAAAILFANEYFPEFVGYALGGVALFVFALVALEEQSSRKRALKRRTGLKRFKK